MYRRYVCVRRYTGFKSSSGGKLTYGFFGGPECVRQEAIVDERRQVAIPFGNAWTSGRIPHDRDLESLPAHRPAWIPASLMTLRSHAGYGCVWMRRGFVYVENRPQKGRYNGVEALECRTKFPGFAGNNKFAPY